MEYKYLEIDFNNRKCIVEVICYDGTKYIVNFINDKNSDFINTFNSKGFGVKLFKDSKPKFYLYGSLSKENALELWSPINSKIEIEILNKIFVYIKPFSLL